MLTVLIIALMLTVILLSGSKKPKLIQILISLISVLAASAILIKLNISSSFALTNSFGALAAILSACIVGIECAAQKALFKLAVHLKRYRLSLIAIAESVCGKIQVVKRYFNRQ